MTSSDEPAAPSKDVKSAIGVDRTTIEKNCADTRTFVGLFSTLSLMHPHISDELLAAAEKISTALGELERRFSANAGFIEKGFSQSAPSLFADSAHLTVQIESALALLAKHGLAPT